MSRSLLFSNGSRATARFCALYDVVGCSLRAHSALNGVSWVRSGSLEIAVGRKIGLMLQNRRHHPLLPSGVAPTRELVSASCLVGADRLRRFELRAVPKHGVHDDSEPPGERDPRLSQGGPLGMVNAQS